MYKLTRSEEGYSYIRIKKEDRQVGSYKCIKVIVKEKLYYQMKSHVCNFSSHINVTSIIRTHVALMRIVACLQILQSIAACAKHPQGKTEKAPPTSPQILQSIAVYIATRRRP